MASAFFFIGSKRSGTTWLTQLINLHPDIHCTFETDIIWIMCCAVRGKPLEPHPEDNGTGLRGTLAAIGPLIDRWKQAGCREIEAAYFEFQRALIDRGYRDVKAHPNCDSLVWIGDKKPRQTADPAVLDFIEAHFTHVRLLHLVRHPKCVVGSSKRVLAEGRMDVPCWHDPAIELLGNWARTERHILELSYRFPMLTIRYEDLTANPISEMRRVHEFFGLRNIPGLFRLVRLSARADRNERYRHIQIAYPEPIREIMRVYGYV